MYFIRIESFLEIGSFYTHDDKIVPTEFVGFKPCVKFFKDLNDIEAKEFVEDAINQSVRSLADADARYNHCYSQFPVCIVTEGYTCINCYREDKKFLYMYDNTRYVDPLVRTELKKGLVNLEFYKMNLDEMRKKARRKE